MSDDLRAGDATPLATVLLGAEGPAEVVASELSGICVLGLGAISPRNGGAIASDAAAGSVES